MSQIQITKPRRAASAGRRGRGEPPLPLDFRDPDITRAKRLQRQARRPAGTRPGWHPALLTTALLTTALLTTALLAPGPADHGPARPAGATLLIATSGAADHDHRVSAACH